MPLCPNGHIFLAFCASSQIFLLESHMAMAWWERCLYIVTLLQPWPLHLAEPITLRDASLWRFIIWRLSILQYHQHQTAPVPITTNRPSSQIMTWVCLRSTLYKVLHKLQTVKIDLYFDKICMSLMKIICSANATEKQQQIFIENWKITNYITFPPANSL